MADSVVLLSGGLDSSANLALARARDAKPKLALTIDYGQRAARAEIAAAQKLCAYYGVPHRVLDAKWLGELGGSALTSMQAVPELKKTELDDPKVTRESAKVVWVPNRNGVLINIAAGVAESLGATRVIVGFNAEEAATFPDNSGKFLKRATQALELSTANHVEVYCYTTELTKVQIVAELRKLSPTFPFELVWSCYHGGEKPCGRCESCQRFDRAVKS